jgi:beta-glucosidase-like glycosyl hydrolase
VPAPQASAEDWIKMVNEFQKGALSTRLGIPMIYGIDAVHGNNNVYKATIFPHNVGLGATRQVLFIRDISYQGRMHTSPGGGAAAPPGF